ncbi:MAG TPA: diaminopimelate epimerase, partial [Leptospiraceae bacterium]|nr:diaminopimelate epimerase [Leptospiraceae bacterium]HNJ05613.1 diaminopimelate epimerase [Leptospiraceae bacterium]
FCVMVHLPFFKMEGAGNDYVYLDALEDPALVLKLTPEMIARMSDRHFGIGGDGVVMILPSGDSEALMRMWNADGSESSMCGNALRCVAFYVHKKNGKRNFTIETKSGRHAALIVESSAKHGTVQVQIGQPRTGPDEIPVNPDVLGLTGKGPFLDVPVSVSGFEGKGTLVSMGNPHCVFFVEDPDSLDLEKIGPLLEHHPAFPARTNVEFVCVQSDGTIRQRTWERGSGETLACGSGVCAVLVASVLSRNMPRKNTIHVRGGDLEASWTEDGVMLSGPARIVFEGTFSV